MADAYTGEMRMFAGSFAPYQWAFCSGTLLSIAEHSALFSLIGTWHGGDGRTSFGLPDMRGRIPVGFGQGPGQPNYIFGQKAGQEQVALTIGQMPAHTHTLQGTNSDANTSDPYGNSIANVTGNFYSDDTATALESMNAGVVEKTGGNWPHDNLMPYRTLSFIICLTGLYPSRN